MGGGDARLRVPPGRPAPLGPGRRAARCAAALRAPPARARAGGAARGAPRAVARELAAGRARGIERLAGKAAGAARELDLLPDLGEALAVDLELPGAAPAEGRVLHGGPALLERGAELAEERPGPLRIRARAGEVRERVQHVALQLALAREPLQVLAQRAQLARASFALQIARLEVHERDQHLARLAGLRGLAGGAGGGHPGAPGEAPRAKSE